MKYYVNIEKEGSRYVSSIPDMEYTSSYGDSIEDALLSIKDAAVLYLEDLEAFPESNYVSEYFIEISDV